MILIFEDFVEILNFTDIDILNRNLIFLKDTCNFVYYNNSKLFLFNNNALLTNNDIYNSFDTSILNELYYIDNDSILERIIDLNNKIKGMNLDIIFQMLSENIKNIEDENVNNINRFYRIGEYFIIVNKYISVYKQTELKFKIINELIKKDLIFSINEDVIMIGSKNDDEFIFLNKDTGEYIDFEDIDGPTVSIESGLEILYVKSTCFDKNNLYLLDNKKIRHFIYYENLNENENDHFKIEKINLKIYNLEINENKISIVESFCDEEKNKKIFKYDFFDNTSFNNENESKKNKSLDDKLFANESCDNNNESICDEDESKRNDNDKFKNYNLSENLQKMNIGIPNIGNLLNKSNEKNKDEYQENIDNMINSLDINKNIYNKTNDKNQENTNNMVNSLNINKSNGENKDEYQKLKSEMEDLTYNKIDIRFYEYKNTDKKLIESFTELYSEYIKMKNFLKHYEIQSKKIYDLTEIYESKIEEMKIRMKNINKKNNIQNIIQYIDSKICNLKDVFNIPVHYDQPIYLNDKNFKNINDGEYMELNIYDDFYRIKPINENVIDLDNIKNEYVNQNSIIYNDNIVANNSVNMNKNKQNLGTTYDEHNNLNLQSNNVIKDQFYNSLHNQQMYINEDKLKNNDHRLDDDKSNNVVNIVEDKIFVNTSRNNMEMNNLENNTINNNGINDQNNMNFNNGVSNNQISNLNINNSIYKNSVINSEHENNNTMGTQNIYQTNKPNAFSNFLKNRKNLFKKP